MPSPGLPFAVSSTWVVSPGDPAARAALLPSAANASMAEPAPSRPRRLSPVIVLLPLGLPRRDAQGDPNLRCKNRTMQAIFCAPTGNTTTAVRPWAADGRALLRPVRTKHG